MNKKIFNGKQFTQTFKQLKTLGIIFTVLLTIAMVATPIGDMLNIKQNIEVYGAQVTLPYVFDVTRGMVLMIVTYVLYTPLLALTCWNFMTKRNACDFYQSLPYTRVCTFLTHAAAMISWQIITLVAAGAASTITYLALSSYFIIDFGAMFTMLLALLGCNLLCLGSITLACTITGNLFSNVIVSGMIIFLPRLLVKLIGTVTASILPILSSSHMFSILGNDYNVLVESILSIFGISGSSFFSLFRSIHGIIYMVVLALIYLGVSCLIFYKRKSETAGNGACSKIVEAIIRIIIGFVIGYFGVVMTIASFINGNVNFSDISALVVCFLLAAGAMMLYEGINTKSLQGAIKSIPSVVIALVLSVLAGTGTYGYIISAEKYHPEALDVASITFKSNESNGVYEEYDDYFTDYISTIEISSDEIEKIFCDALKENIEKIGHDSDRDSMYEYMYKRSSYLVGFKSGVNTTYRNIYLNKTQVKEIMEKIQKVSEYKEAMLELPDAKDASMQINGGSAVTTEQVNSLYESILSEKSQIEFTDWYDITHSDGAGDVYLYITFSRNGNMYYANMCLDERLPKTYVKYVEMVNENSYGSKLYSDMTSYLEKEIAGNATTNSNKYISMQVHTPSTGESDYYDVEEYLRTAADAKEILSNALTRMKKKDASSVVDFTKPFITFSYYEYDEEGGYMLEDGKIMVFVPLERSK